jgi:chaperonin GroEL
MSNQIKFSEEAREQLLAGVEKLANAVTATMGPNGRNVIIEQSQGMPVSTRDGVTVAKAIDLEDVMENIGAQLVKQASIKTADQAGDGTTTSTLLAAALLKRGMSAISDKECNAVQVKKGIESAAQQVVAFLEEESVEITDEEQLKQVATISANNDEEVGKLISAAMDKVGRDGVVTIEESRTGETYLEVVEGMQFNRGYKSPYFVTDNNTMTAVLNKPLVLIVDKRITAAKDLLPILEACSSKNKSLLIISDDIDGEALSTLVVNKMRGILQVVAVKAPEFGDRKKAMMEDIAILTGGTVVSPEKGMRLDKFNSDWLGSARKVVIGKEETTIVDGKGETEKLEERLEEIKSLIDNSKSPFEIETLQDRLGRLIGGIAVVHVGGHSEVEMKEKKDRIEDALHATKAALEEGILPGGGTALYRAAESLSEDESETDFGKGRRILANSILEPLQTILKNAGYNAHGLIQVMNMIDDEDNFWMGYDLSQSSIVNMLEEGIIDPAKVTRLALENAVSVAGTVMVTEAVVSNIKKEDSNEGVDLSQFM